MVDCSHGNSQKNQANQPKVVESIMAQRQHPDHGIFGIMLESFLVAGNQPLKGPRAELVYGQSITDQCMDWETTENLLEMLGSGSS